MPDVELMLNECAILFVWNTGTKVRGVSSSGKSEERWKNVEGCDLAPSLMWETNYQFSFQHLNNLAVHFIILHMELNPSFNLAVRMDGSRIFGLGPNLSSEMRLLCELGQVFSFLQV